MSNINLAQRTKLRTFFIVVGLTICAPLAASDLSLEYPANPPAPLRVLELHLQPIALLAEDLE